MELKDTIKSVKGQLYSNIEYIVVDGNSSDNTKQILVKNKNNISKYISETDTGIFSAMNKGIQLSTGSYLYFLNAGDTFASNNVLNQVSKQLEKSHPDILYANVTQCQENNKWLTRFNKINRWFLIQNSICHQAVFTRREVFQKFGLFNENYQIAGDYDWFVKSWFNHEVSRKYVDINIANFWLTGKSSSPEYRTQVLSECDDVRKKYFYLWEIWLYILYKWLGAVKQNL